MYNYTFPITYFLFDFEWCTWQNKHNDTFDYFSPFTLTIVKFPASIHDIQQTTSVVQIIKSDLQYIILNKYDTVNIFH